MRINDSPADLFAGIDNLSLDTRSFDPSQDDIEHICRFFSIGKLQHYEKEKGVAVSHTNFFVFVVTARGQYALKFYPMYAAKMIAIEYAVNRFLIAHHFPTPVMHAGHDGQPFFPSKDRLAACFAYVNGLPAWQLIKQRSTIRQINTTMLSLKNILSTAQGRIPFFKQEGLVAAVHTLNRTSREMAPYDKKNMIDASLKDVCQSYQQHQPLFTRRWLHNNAGLTNFLIDKETVYTLDLSHIREDYALSDLASLVISCLFLEIPATTIKTIVKDYVTRHKMGSEHLLVLNALVTIGLIREYLKNVRREKSVDVAAYSPGLPRAYRSHLSARKELIAAVLFAHKPVLLPLAFSSQRRCTI